MRQFFWMILLFSVLAQACTKNDDVDPPVEVGETSVLVLNEGLFRRGNASITGYEASSETLLGTVYDPALSSAGGLDILQSATVLGDTIALVANNSNLIVLLQKDDLKEISRFEALGSPRYITRLATGNFLVTDLFAERLLELNPDFSEARVVSHEGQAEAVVPYGAGALFASPSRHSVFYYDALLGEVTDSINLPFRANTIRLLADDRVAICGGILEQGESGGLAVVDWGTKEIEFSMSFSESESSLYPRLDVSNDHLYCLQQNLIILPLSDLTSSSVTEVDLSGIVDPYGLGIGPNSGELYVADAKNGLALGEVVRMSAEGIPFDTFPVGIFPNGFVFR